VRAAPDQGELLPPELLAQYGLPSFADALQALHKPLHMDEHAAAKRRLAFQVGCALCRVGVWHIVEHVAWQRHCAAD
jgi:RecG-like helicase